MIAHAWTVICSLAITDRETNNITLVNSVEQINLPNDADLDLIAGMPMVVATLWVRSDFDVPAQGRGRIRLTSPSGQELMTMNAEIDLSKYERLRTIRPLQAFPVTVPGRYVFHTELWNKAEGSWQLASSVPLKVVMKPMEELMETLARKN